MEKLFKLFRKKISETDLVFFRENVVPIDWKNRLIGIKGARGVGKTTFLLQHIKKNFSIDETVLYTSLDDMYFQANTLVDFAEEFHLLGGRHLFLDEVHKYPNWSIELKNIYDNYSDLKIVFTSSSLLEIYKGDADLSRRAVTYTMQGLSFREYLKLENKLNIPPVSLNEIITNHIELASEITDELTIITLFKKYLKKGYYPYYRESEDSYYQKLTNTVRLILEVDVPSVHNTEYQTIHKLKKLLYVIAHSVPYQPNISKLSQKIETTSRSSTLQYLEYLEKANLTANLKTSSKGNNYLVKPDKIYLDNTYLIYAIGEENLNEGNLRETFFRNQLGFAHQVNTSKESDFLVDEKFTFEIGGRNKKTDQIKGVKNSFLAQDNIEFGYQNKIPLWLFGFMY